MLRTVRLMTTCVIAATLATESQAGVPNGNFEAGLPSGGAWNHEGNVSPLSTATGNTVAFLQEPDLVGGYPGAGGVSRLYQTFALPAAPDKLSFTYRFDYWPGERQATSPPDSLTVFLDDGGACAQQVIPPVDGTPPSYILLYADSDGNQQYDGSCVTIVGPDAARAYSVEVDISGLAGGTPVTLEFGLAGAGNGQISAVSIDNVATGCVFEDDFNRPDSAALDMGWQEAERGAGTHENGVATLLGGKAYLTGGPLNSPMAWIAQNNIYVGGYDSITVSYDWSGDANVDSPFDHLWVEWRTCSADDWPEFTEEDTDPDGPWYEPEDIGLVRIAKHPAWQTANFGPTQQTINLDGQTCIDLRFRTTMSQEGEGVFIDDVSICGSVAGE